MSSRDLLQILLLVIGSGGAIGGIIAFVKLRPDIQSASVLQAQGAVQATATAMQRIEAERDYWQKRAETAETRVAECEKAMELLEAKVENWSHLHGTESID